MAYQRKTPPAPSPSKQTQAPVPKTQVSKPTKSAPLPNIGKQGFTNKAQGKKK